MTDRHDYLRRLPPEFYRAQAYVHWTMTIENRQTGWLVPVFYYKFLELLTHTAFRYGFCCPIFCLMPDHMHLLWMGIADECDQRVAMRFFRKQVNSILEKVGTRLQLQGHDHVLNGLEREQTGFEEVFEYIARNPERAGLVKPDEFGRYPYTACLIPGVPELQVWQHDFWERFWRVYSSLRKNGLTPFEDENS